MSAKYYTIGGVSMRPVQESDLTILATHRNDPETWGNLTSGLPVWLYKQKQWLASLGEKDMYFIANIDSKDVGLLRVTDIDWQNSTAAVGLDIFKEYRGRGYASLCMDMLVLYCFDQLNLHRLWLLVLDTNDKARKVYEQIGFKHEGAMRDHIYRSGKYHDYILMGMLKDEYTPI